MNAEKEKFHLLMDSFLKYVGYNTQNFKVKFSKFARFADVEPAVFGDANGYRLEFSLQYSKGSHRGILKGLRYPIEGLEGIGEVFTEVSVEGFRKTTEKLCFAKLVEAFNGFLERDLTLNAGKDILMMTTKIPDVPRLIRQARERRFAKYSRGDFSIFLEESFDYYSVVIFYKNFYPIAFDFTESRNLVVYQKLVARLCDELVADFDMPKQRKVALEILDYVRRDFKFNLDCFQNIQTDKIMFL